jgi:hypothetical protein
MTGTSFSHRFETPFRRSGLSLLETVLSVAILAAALAALGHQTFVGLRAGVRTDIESRAALLCQSQLDSVLLDEEASLPIRNQPMLNEPGWLWSAELRPVSELEGLQWLVVSVRQPGVSEAISQFTLSRLIPAEPRLPQFGLGKADQGRNF